MPDIPGFWDIGPHDPLPVEDTWREFVQANGGELVSNLVVPQFHNADFIFRELGIVAELKQIETEFLQSRRVIHGLTKLMKQVAAENPQWRPGFVGGSTEYQSRVSREFVQLLREPISRVLKKANRQLRESKKAFGIETPSGILILVNDGFTGISPYTLRALICHLLLNRYSSIDCMLYLTLNRYLEIAGTKVPRLIWAPTYSVRAPAWLVQFIDDLGRRWGDFLERKVGPFTDRVQTGDGEVLKGSAAIVLPGERRK